MYTGSLLFFHQALQVEKESGAEEEEDIGDSQEPHIKFINFLLAMVRKKLVYIITMFMVTTLLDSLDI